MDTIIERIIKENKTPIYVYDYDSIKRNICNLYSILPQNGYIYYSVKANPNLAICQIVKNLVGNAEVSSLGEIKCALKAGFKRRNIFFSGPGKTKEELNFAIKKRIKINVESLQELEIIGKLSEKENCVTELTIRINPDFSLWSSGIAMSGRTSQFGIDASEMGVAVKIIKNSRFLKLIGISIYLGSQIINANSIVSNTHEIIKLFLRFQTEYGLQLNELDVGGGFGVSYFDKNELDIKLLQVAMKQLFAEYQNSLENVKIYFESGRYILAESGHFITKVLYKKESKGRKYIVCDGGFNNAMIASFFTREIRGNFPISVLKIKEECESEEYYISGPLCSPKDIIGSKIVLPKVEVGDYLMVDKVGAYGLTYSPILFISRIIPAEILIKGKEYYIIRSREQVSNKKQCKLPLTVMYQERVKKRSGGERKVSN